MTHNPNDPAAGFGGVPPGAYPPPAGGYYPPPLGYPAPPGYGHPPGYGPPPGYGKPNLDIGHGLRWSWNAFTQNVFPLIGGLLIWGAVITVLFGVPYALAFVTATETPALTDYSSDSQSTMQFGAVSILLIVVAAIALWLASAAAASAIITGFLKIADGRPVTVATFLKPHRFGAMLALQTLMIAAVLVGFVLCVVPGIIAGFLMMFAHFALLDRGLSPIDAIKTSVDIVKNNFVPVLLMYLINAALSTVGQFACLVGLLVAIPVGYLFQVYTYRLLSGGQVAPLVPATSAGPGFAR